MTKKFTLKEIDNYNHGRWVTDIILDNGIELPQSTSCDLLNEQHETIQQLKSELNEIKQLKCIMCGLELECTIRNELK